MNLRRPLQKHENVYTDGPKYLPGDIKSHSRPFCATPAVNSTESRAGIDYSGPGVWGPGHKL